ncbi:MAG: hypothetical protein GWN37_06210 [Gammaproteobacteria bacterium]|nr:hypothetical protein [Gammaproteobacteria bacterium]
MDYCVFIHTNHKQIVGAKVAEYALRRNSTHNDEFEVKIVQTEDYPWLREFDGQLYLRDGVKRVWLYDDLQSFTPLRFVPPKLMQYQGRAVVIDPDIFAVGDVWELLSRDMQGKAIMCRARSGPKGYIDRCLASSVMLLDNAKLTHWDAERGFREMFEFKRDYQPWICLKLEPRETIGLLENEWNDFDRLTAKTKMVHNTRRRTQPWKTGLQVDWRPAEKFRLFPPAAWLMRARRRLFGEYGLLGKYKPHPDPNQERYFFGLLKECLERGVVSDAMLRNEMRRDHVRHDALDVLERTAPLARDAQPPLQLPAG